MRRSRHGGSLVGKLHGATLLAVCALVGVLGLSTAAALADTAPISSSSALPGSDPNHETPTELLASQIASHIANKQVSIDCEGDSDWAQLVSGYGGDPNAESGYVPSQWNSATGQLVSLSSTAYLASNTCLPLMQFAEAATKPTTCVPAASAALVNGARKTAGRRVVRRSRFRARTAAPGPCYLGNGKTAAPMTPAYWTNYSLYALAILTLAHESIHLSGIVGGTLPGGQQVGDPQAEAKADCYGMQWMPYVAEQLGDTRDDAQAIAEYFYDKIYPLVEENDPSYWSPDCRPGGALDIRPSSTTAWP
jgi:hypothetical protein